MPRKKQALISTSDVQAAVNPNIAPPELRGEFHIDDVATISPLHARSVIDVELFMNELIEIEVEQDDNPDSPVFIPSGHQGLTQWIQRGCVQMVKRKFFHSLLVGKKVSIASSFGRHGEREYNNLNATAAPTFRARLVSDKNVEHGGSKWVQSVMSQPA